jgi:hypothetical protein
MLATSKRRGKIETRDERVKEPASAGVISLAPGISPGKMRLKKPLSLVRGDGFSAALFEGSLSVKPLIPGLTPGALLCRRLRRLIDPSFPAVSFMWLTTTAALSALVLASPSDDLRECLPCQT